MVKIKLAAYAIFGIYCMAFPAISWPQVIGLLFTVAMLQSLEEKQEDKSEELQKQIDDIKSAISLKQVMRK